MTTPTAPVSAAPAGTSDTNTGTSAGPQTQTQQGGNVAGTQQSQPQTPSINQQLNELLQKAGGLEITANGKKHKLNSVEQLVRAAQMGIPIDSSLKQLNEQRQKVTPFIEAINALQSGDDDAAESILERMVSPDRLKNIMLRKAQREVEEAQKLQNLSPRERELYQQMQKLSREKAQWEAQQKRLQEQEGQLQEQQRVGAIKTHIGQAINKTFEIMGLPQKLEPIAVELMKPFIRSMLNNGMSLDPQVLAEKAGMALDELLRFRTNGLEGEKLLGLFGNDIGLKYNKAMLAKLNAPRQAPGSQIASQNQNKQPQMLNKGTTITPTSEGDKQKRVVPDFRKPIL